MNLRLVLVAAVMLAPGSAVAGDIVGPARALEGSSLVIGKKYLRLCGVDNPAHGGVAYRRDSKALAELIDGQTVRCVPLGEGTPCDGLAGGETYKRAVAQCFVSGRDLAAELIKSGSACAWTADSGDAYANLGCTSVERARPGYLPQPDAPTVDDRVRRFPR